MIKKTIFTTKTAARDHMTKRLHTGRKKKHTYVYIGITALLLYDIEYIIYITI